MKTKQSGSSIVIILVILTTVVILSGLVYLFLQNNSQTSQTTTDNSSNQLTANEVDEKKYITKTLPNGSVATYPDTEGNRRIIFQKQSASQSNEVVKLSNSLYEDFLSKIDDTMVNELCGNDDELKAVKTDIIVGLLNTTTKEITAPQNQNCLEVIASEDTSDISLRFEAQKVQDQINRDIDEFLASSVIK